MMAVVNRPISIEGPLAGVLEMAQLGPVVVL